MNVAMRLEMAAGDFADREAVRCGSASFDSQELQRAARATAAALVASECRHAALLEDLPYTDTGKLLRRQVEAELVRDPSP